VVAGDLAKLRLQLLGAGLDFLEAEDVGLLLLDPGKEALLVDGSDPVDVPGEDLQRVRG